MSFEPTRGIAVLDIGATNVKATLFDAELDALAAESIAAPHAESECYPSIDPEPILTFIEAVLPEFDRRLPVDALVPCAHGSALALLDRNGAASLPIMYYEAEPPSSVAAGYANVAPGFEEVFAPTNPMALTLGRQLYWQETMFPQAFRNTRTALPLAQYLGFRLSGVKANEISALGAQTHLWAPLRGAYSTLAERSGWAALFPPLRPAWEPLGRLTRQSLRGRANVLTGVHDSNANLLPYLGGAPFALLSTGTWVIGFADGVDIRTLDPRRDQVSNTTVFGNPIASCRFMGGREFEVLADGSPPRLASVALVADLLARGVMAWPAFTDSGGPAANTGGRGRIDGSVRTDGERTSLAALYCAQMSALALRQMGVHSPVIVDGPFAENLAYMATLAACLPDQPVFAAVGPRGTAVGAATLALMGDGETTTQSKTRLQRIATPAALRGNAALLSWFDRLDCPLD